MLGRSSATARGDSVPLEQSRGWRPRSFCNREEEEYKHKEVSARKSALRQPIASRHVSSSRLSLRDPAQSSAWRLRVETLAISNLSLAPCRSEPQEHLSGPFSLEGLKLFIRLSPR